MAIENQSKDTEQTSSVINKVKQIVSANNTESLPEKSIHKFSRVHIIVCMGSEVVRHEAG